MKIYHHNDLDGRCAGAIALRWAEGPISYKGIELIELDYKDPIMVESIKENERIIIVDFSFKPEFMEKVLKKTTYITWIDHHKTAFEYKYSIELAGMRDEKYAGCELAWMHFCNGPMPRAVELIGDRDKWAWKMTETANFNQGLKLYDCSPKSQIWDDLFHQNSIDLVVEICRRGATCIRFRDSFCADYAKSYGFETEFEGQKAFAMGIYMFGSEAFGDRMKQYPICLSFEFDGKKWIVGLYSETIDVSEIAKAKGGGGHKGAAGFVCNTLPFKSSAYSPSTATEK